MVTVQHLLLRSCNLIMHHIKLANFCFSIILKEEHEYRICINFSMFCEQVLQYWVCCVKCLAKKKKFEKKKLSRNECSCKNSESVYACLRLSMWFMSMYFDYSAMIQSRIVLSIYVFCLSWQRREILSKCWWVASSISSFFFFSCILTTNSKRADVSIIIFYLLKYSYTLF